MNSPEQEIKRQFVSQMKNYRKMLNGTFGNTKLTEMSVFQQLFTVPELFEPKDKAQVNKSAWKFLKFSLFGAFIGSAVNIVAGKYIF